MTPTTGIPKRIGAIYNRRPTTPWSEKEIKAYKQLVKDVPLPTFEDDLDLVERYYFAERKKGDKGIHRRDLYTFLFNFRGELDRAREWNARVARLHGHKRKKEEKSGNATDADYQRIGNLAKVELEKLRQTLKL